MRLIVHLALVASVLLLVSELSVQLWTILGDFKAMSTVLVSLGIVAGVRACAVLTESRVYLSPSCCLSLRMQVAGMLSRGSFRSSSWANY